jgi:hypothetical protein
LGCRLLLRGVGLTVIEDLRAKLAVLPHRPGLLVCLQEAAGHIAVVVTPAPLLVTSDWAKGRDDLAIRPAETTSCNDSWLEETHLDEYLELCLPPGLAVASRGAR